jgi:hypothetical protein
MCTERQIRSGPSKHGWTGEPVWKCFAGNKIGFVAPRLSLWPEAWIPTAKRVLPFFIEHTCPNLQGVNVHLAASAAFVAACSFSC